MLTTHKRIKAIQLYAFTLLTVGLYLPQVHASTPSLGLTISLGKSTLPGMPMPIHNVPSRRQPLEAYPTIPGPIGYCLGPYYSLEARVDYALHSHCTLYTQAGICQYEGHNVYKGTWGSPQQPTDPGLLSLGLVQEAFGHMHALHHQHTKLGMYTTLLYLSSACGVQWHPTGIDTPWSIHAQLCPAYLIQAKRAYSLIITGKRPHGGREVLRIGSKHTVCQELRGTALQQDFHRYSLGFVGGIAYALPLGIRIHCNVHAGLTQLCTTKATGTDHTARTYAMSLGAYASLW